MSADFTGGPTEGQASEDAGQPVIADLFYEFAAYLYDYCEGILRDPVAAAAVLQDTLIIAAADIGKLRNPDRLRVWLYSIARRQCRMELSRLSELPRRPGITEAGDFSANRADAFEQRTASADAVTADAVTAEFEIRDLEAEERARETQLIVIAALDGLSDRDREVLNLAFRHSFDGPALAAILGVSERHASALLSSAGTQFESSAAAVAVLRAGWAGCPVPGTIIGEWDPASPPLTPRLRRRLSRHIDSCGRCSRSLGDLVFGAELLGGVALTIPSEALRKRITRAVFAAPPGALPRRLARRAGTLDADGFPAQPQAWRSPSRLAAAAAALVVLFVAGAVAHAFESPNPVGSTAAADISSAFRLPALPRSALFSMNTPVSGSGHQGQQAPVSIAGTLGPSPIQVGVFPTATPDPKAPVPSSSSQPAPAPSPTRSHQPGPSPTPVRSPSPTSSPTPVRSPSPTSSPTPVPTPTSTPTPTPTPTPTDTPTPTPTATDTSAPTPAPTDTSTAAPAGTPTA